MQPCQTFPLTARATALAGCGAVAKALKLVFSYGTEFDPTLAAIFLAKLARSIPQTHVPLSVVLQDRFRSDPDQGRYGRLHKHAEKARPSQRRLDMGAL